MRLTVVLRYCKITKNMNDLGLGLKVTLTHRFLETCDKFGNNTAIIDDTGSLTYAELGAAAKNMAALLKGLTSRQNIGILLPTCKEFPVAYFAVLLMGKTPVPLNFLMSSAQISYIIKDASLDTVITISPFRNLVEGHINHCVCLDELRVKSSEFREFLLPTPNSELKTQNAVLLYTSGTTANPKGVMLTHKNILSVLEGVAPSFKFTHEDVILGVLPLFHSFALTVTLALPVCFGAKVVYITRFSGPRVLELIEKHKITIVAAIPSMYRVMLRTLGS
ncbi:MAG TPA: AMP-binding protein, partial [Candidatus Brocadiales bacterium]|nr:AMP-binding protein [Candidatus Brocadiales bacterium]